jgi:hypothetical protein
MNFQNYKFRPSDYGNIMIGFDKPILTDRQMQEMQDLSEKPELTALQAEKLQQYKDRLAAGHTLSAGAITHCQKLVKQIVYQYTEEIDTRPMQKGIMCEQDSIDFLNGTLFASYIKFPEGEYQNDYLISRGCDIKHGDVTRDIKTSWSKKTHPETKAKAYDPVNEWQGRGYMWLFDTNKHYIDHVLVDTPDELRGFEPDSMHEVEHLPDHLRITTLCFERNKSLEDQIKKAVNLARLEMDRFYKEITQ